MLVWAEGILVGASTAAILMNSSGPIDPAEISVRTSLDAGSAFHAVGACPKAREPAAIDNEVIMTYWHTIKPTFQNLARAARIARLRGQRRPRDACRRTWQ